MGRENGIIALHESAMIRAGHVNLEAHCRERPYLHETERDQRYISTPWSRRCYSALGFDFGEDLRRSLASRASSQRRPFFYMKLVPGISYKLYKTFIYVIILLDQ